MPDKEGSDDEKKSTKSVVNKKQKQMLNQEEYATEMVKKIVKKISARAVYPTVAQNKVRGEILKGDDLKIDNKNPVKKQKKNLDEEGYDVARDEGRVRPSKDKKDATTMPVSDEVKKTQKKNKGPSALELVKKKYKGQIMDVKKEELDLTKVAEAFGGYIIEAKKGDDMEDSIRGKKRIVTSTPSLSRNIPKKQRISSADQQKAANIEADKRVADAEKSGKIDDFTSKPIKGAPDTTKLQRDADTGKAIVNPVETSKQTAEKKARVSTAGTGGKKLKNQNKFSTETGFEDAIKGKTKTSVTTSTKKPVKKPKVTGAKVTGAKVKGGKVTTPKVTGDVTGVAPDPISKSDLDKINAVTPAQKAKTFKQSFGTPTGADPKTGKPTYMRSGVLTKSGKPKKAARYKGKLTPDERVAKIKKQIDAKNPTYIGKSGKRLPVPREEPGTKGFKGFKKRAQRSVVKTGKQVAKVAAPVTSPVAKFAKASPLGATIAGIEVAKITPGLKRFFAVKPPLPPKPKGGKVGRRTAG